MEAMKLKYLKGNLCSEGFNTNFDAWLKMWKEEVSQCKSNGKSLIVLEVPNGTEWLDLGARFDLQIQEMHQE